MFNYQMQRKLARPLPPIPNTAIIAGVYYDGVSLYFPGDIQPSQKHYRGLAGVTYTVGQTVQITKVSGTYLVGQVLADIDTGITYLYKEGDERSALTGGWGNDYYLNAYYTRANMTKAASYLRAYYASSATYYGVSFGAANAIDLTQYSKLVIDLNVVTSPKNLFIQYGTSKSGSTWTALLSASSPTVGSHLYELDISSLSGLQYIRFYTNHDTGTYGCDVQYNRIWLEK